MRFRDRYIKDEERYKKVINIVNSVKSLAMSIVKDYNTMTKDDLYVNSTFIFWKSRKISFNVMSFDDWQYHHYKQNKLFRKSKILRRCLYNLNQLRYNCKDIRLIKKIDNYIYLIIKLKEEITSHYSNIYDNLY